MKASSILYPAGVWGVGLASRKCGVNKVPLGDTEESWVLRHDGRIFHKNEEKGKIAESIQEGDVVVSTHSWSLQLIFNNKSYNYFNRCLMITCDPEMK